MNRTVTIVDYGVGNMLSVIRAFEHCGAEVIIASKPAVVKDAERLVLPGVGAFQDGMESLHHLNLVHAIREYALDNRPFLGICLGMQMMFDSSNEFGFHEGLGLVGGSVEAIPLTSAEGVKHKVPHIGWSEMSPSSDLHWEGTILDSLPLDISAYFVHSFTAFPNNLQHRLADTYYGGRQISAVVKKGNLYGTQFHPEKSGAVGLKIVSNFLSIDR